MTARTAQDATAVLNRLSQGDPAAARELFRWLYMELRQLARAQIDGHRQPTMQATALVHEAYMRLFGEPRDIEWDNRAHFFGAAARIMRQIRIDEARKRKRLKRGGDRKAAPLDIEPAVFDRDPDDLLSIHEALEKLQQADPRKVELINLRYFSGLTEEETAQALGLSRRTVQLEWRIARAWLHRELTKGDTNA